MPDSASFLGLSATADPKHWILPVRPDLCAGPNGPEFLFGGVGLGAAILAMERVCGRPTIWATAQYLAFARMPATVDFKVVFPVEGRFNTQARAVGFVEGREILTVNAALGQRPSDISMYGATAPAVAPPEACVLVPPRSDRPGGIHAAMEFRVAKGRFRHAVANEPLQADGHVVVWARMRDRPLDSTIIAIMADFLPSAVGHAVGRPSGGNSLDNTIRIRRILPTDWVLCDMMIDGIHGGFGHGHMNLFDAQGELMASASQSFILRAREAPEENHGLRTREAPEKNQGAGLEG